MSLIRREPRTWDPFREFEEMSSRFNRLFARPHGGDENLKAFDWAPSINVSETPTAYVVKAELPGIKKEDVHLTLADGVLTISGERKLEQEHKDEKLHRIETSYGSFMRRFAMPDDAAADGIEASYKDGILNVKIAKIPPEKKQPETRRIPVA